ncbi:hypothetical protein CHH28_00855 [Bacterioplanes sanyensis]|uniref:DUF2256 domain-containing protein n=1 Tax=Bacterioplanes sanyensis TaxID=1249553 RepID=A0A222FE74_9GAMM|nr:DUF2256 domain-containing protein [Bacterioplanes sanyensis]ASP37318.1 hypothetical protein CHH28_00855 [Bacterioplanes sanyensis]
MAHKKTQLAEKTCQTCGRPFSWRKKWQNVWQQVRYCSERCRRNKHTPPPNACAAGMVEDEF